MALLFHPVCSGGDLAYRFGFEGRSLGEDPARTLTRFEQPGGIRERYVLQRGAQRIPLGLGETVIGRAADADVVLDNHMVSRRHAKITVTDAAVFVEDLGSVNGVRVDGEAVQGKLLVSPGARISIADAVFVLLRSESGDAVRATQRVPTRDPADEAPADATTRRTHAFQLMAGVVDKAIALGKADEAERLLGTLMADVLDEAQRTRQVPREVAQAAASAAVRLAAATAKSHWVEYPIRLYLALQAPLPLATVDELFNVARRAPRMDLPLLHRYVALLDEQRLGPSERFVVQRLQALARMMGAVSGR